MKSLKQFLIVILIYILLNSPFWILGKYLMLNRSVFNVDLLFPLLISRFSRSLSVCVIFLLFIFDFVVANSKQYYFNSPNEWMSSANFLYYLSFKFYSTYILKLIIVFVFYLCLVFFFLNYINKIPFYKNLKIVLTGLFLAIVFHVLNGSSQVLWPSATQVIPFNIASSPTEILVQSLLFSNNSKIKKIPGSKAESALDDIYSWAKGNENKSIVFVIVESWGVNVNDAVNNMYASLLMKDISNKFTIERENVLFSGSTTFGELRELCGVVGSYQNITSNNLTGCLPQRLVNLGWHTFGIHGFAHSMFLRSEWWPNIGLQKFMFMEDVNPTDSQKCGGLFLGVCDSNIIEIAFSKANKSKSFIYVLTLNSHLPLLEKKLPKDLQSFCINSSINSTDCLLVNLLSKVFVSINYSLRQKSPAMRPLVVIVGDHAPPFRIPYLRNMYSQNEVPKFILKPK